MRHLANPLPLLLLPLPFAIFVACASSEETPDTSRLDGGAEDSAFPETGSSEDAGDAGADVDREALRCSGDFCLVDLPNPGAYGFTKWVFRTVQFDPVVGIWALANGVLGVDEATAQLLRFDGAAWQAVHAPTLGSGADKRNIRLASLSANGAGKLLAVGSTIDDGSGVIVRGDGTAFTTDTFEVPLEASWFAQPDLAWVAGRGGAIYRSTTEGDWISESSDTGGELLAVWGSGPDEVYVSGEKQIDEHISLGYLGHRTVSGADATWTFATFPELQTMPFGDHAIYAGIALAAGPRFWAAPDVLARGTTVGGETIWEAAPFDPRVALNAFWARGPNDIWAVGNVGRVYHFDGTTWKDELLVFNGAPLVANLTGIAGTTNGELFIVGDGVALRRKTP